MEPNKPWFASNFGLVESLHPKKKKMKFMCSGGSGSSGGSGGSAGSAGSAGSGDSGGSGGLIENYGFNLT